MFISPQLTKQACSGGKACETDPPPPYFHAPLHWKTSRFFPWSHACAPFSRPKDPRVVMTRAQWDSARAGKELATGAQGLGTAREARGQRAAFLEPLEQPMNKCACP